MKRREIYEATMLLQNACFLLRFRCASERLISLFSKKPMDAVGISYIDPIDRSKKVIVVNALGLRFAPFNNVKLEELFLCKYLEKIEVYTVQSGEAKTFVKKVQETTVMNNENWVKKLIKKSWLQDNAYQLISSYLDVKEPIHTASYTIKDNSIYLKEDEDFLSSVWPYIYKMLLENEYQLAIPIADSEDPILQLFIALEQGKIGAKEFQRDNPTLPMLRKNRAVIFEVSPCKDLETIRSQFHDILKDINSRIKKGLPVDIYWNDLIKTYNDLTIAMGERFILPTMSNSYHSVNLIGEKTDMVDMKMESGKTVRIGYNSQNFDDFTFDEQVEILRFLDAISNNEKPYEELRSSLTKSIASFDDSD